MQKVFNVLKKDSQFRKEGVTDDLFKLEELNTNVTWDFSLPTLVHEHRLTNVDNHELDITVFRKHFEKYAFPLTLVDMSNLCIAGGCVKSLILNDAVNDVDIFMYGIKNVDKANKRVEKFVTDLYAALVNIQSGKYVDLNIWNTPDDNKHIKGRTSSTIITKSYKKDKKVDSDDSDNDNSNNDNSNNDDGIDDKTVESEDEISQIKEKTVLTPSEYRRLNAHKYLPDLNTSIFVMYNGNTVTINAGNLKIQIVLRLYNTLSEILHGFDLGSSAVGFDGKDVYFTSLSKFCYENMVNIYDGTRRSTSYEYRLQKYLNNGFKIVLPNLDIKKLRTQYFKYNLSEVCELPFMPFVYHNLDRNMIFISDFVNKNSSMSQSDYLLADFDLYDGELDAATYMKLNQFNLDQLVKGEDKFMRYKTVNKEIAMILNKKEKINTWKLNFDVPILTQGTVVSFYGKLFKDYKQNKLTFKNIVKSFSVLEPKEILSNLVTDTEHKFMESLMDKQKEKLFEQLDRVNKDTNVHWITENATTQLTSSFNPIIEDPKVWYGDLYLDLVLEEEPEKKTSEKQHIVEHVDEPKMDKKSKVKKVEEVQSVHTGSDDVESVKESKKKDKKNKSKKIESDVESNGTKEDSDNDSVRESDKDSVRESNKDSVRESDKDSNNESDKGSDGDSNNESDKESTVESVKESEKKDKKSKNTKEDFDVESVKEPVEEPKKKSKKNKNVKEDSDVESVKEPVEEPKKKGKKNKNVKEDSDVESVKEPVEEPKKKSTKDEPKVSKKPKVVEPESDVESVKETKKGKKGK